MKPLFRPFVGMLMVAIALTGSALAQAPATPVAGASDALKQLPEKPLVIFKFNNLERISKKAADFSKKLGLANLDPRFGDPLTALKAEMNIKNGLNAGGDLVLALYEPSGEDQEPRMLALVPVSDYKAFLTNLNNVKADGEISTFTPPDEDDPHFVANWAGYAVMSQDKALISKKGTGITITGLAGKQMAANDLTIFANVPVLAAKALPQIKEKRPEILAQMEQQLQNDQNFRKEYIPVARAVVNQVLNGVEQALTDGQAATFGMNLSEKGLTTSFVAEFKEGSSFAKNLKDIKNTDASLLAGLPAGRKYYAYGGAVIDPQATTRMFDQILGPVTAELQKVGDAKAVNQVIESVKQIFQAANGFSFGYVVPTGQPGQQGMIQAVGVYQGDAKKIHEASRKSSQGSAEMMKMFSQQGADVNVNYQQNTKTIDGAQLDSMKMTFKFDQNTPEGAQAAQMIQMIYGPNGITSYMGPVNDKSYVVVMGGDDQLLSTAVAAAKKGEAGPSQQEGMKNVASQLPQNRAAAYYVDLGNIVTSVLQFMGQMGMQMPLKLPPNLPPIGVTLGTEGSAMRVDTHVSSELIESLVSGGIQAFMMMRGGQQQPGQL